ncbi:MAG: hypothetical protein V7784_14215 [Oceanospirillaceae bacterium]
MGTKKRANYFYLLVAVFLILIGSGVILNWNNLFRPSIIPQPHVRSGNSLAPYKIAVYYFPGQKNAAQGLSYYFKQKNYLVDLLPADNVEKLQYKRYSPSHIFFKNEELAQAMSVKSDIEKIIGHPVNAYRFVMTEDKVSMMVVFTNHY